MGASASRQHAPARMLVYAKEYSLWPSRAKLPAGRVIVQLLNRGQDAHDLRVRRLSAVGQMVGRTQWISKTQSGALSEAKWRVRPGRYELYCSLPNHYSYGMHTVVVVK